jgi:guanylate kinase
MDLASRFNQQGELMVPAFIGPSGAGKTTTMLLIEQMNPRAQGVKLPYDVMAKFVSDTTKDLRPEEVQGFHYHAHPFNATKHNNEGNWITRGIVPSEAQNNLYIGRLDTFARMVNLGVLPLIDFSALTVEELTLRMWSLNVSPFNILLTPEKGLETIHARLIAREAPTPEKLKARQAFIDKRMAFAEIELAQNQKLIDDGLIDIEVPFGVNSPSRIAIAEACLAGFATHFHGGSNEAAQAAVQATIAVHQRYARFIAHDEAYIIDETAVTSFHHRYPHLADMLAQTQTEFDEVGNYAEVGSAY